MIRIIVIAAVVFAIVTPAAAKPIICQPSAAAVKKLHPGQWARYRLIDGRQCWYKGKERLPKSMLAWAQSSRGGGESRPARRTWTDDRRSPAMKREPAGARLSGIADKASSWRKQSEAGVAPGPRDISAGRSWHELAPAQQAGILCNDPSFRQFLERTTDYTHADHALMVRQICGVESRADIRPGTPATDKWRKLVSDYRGWMKEAEVV